MIQNILIVRVCHLFPLIKQPPHISCSLGLNPSQMSSSSGDLLLEMMESETPPRASPPREAGDPEVSSRRISPDPPRTEGKPSATRSPGYSAPKESNRKRPELSGVRPDALMNLLEQAAVSETHRALMGTVVERISSAESGLHEAFMSLLTGFEVHEMMYIVDSTAHF